ncbi:hypothetical protein, partial [Paenibacillus alvei]|uniref:hypothetical protein n=1 Tax=Paenibacillus alvei TaxID=44250 RepID=UPI00227E8CB0
AEVGNNETKRSSLGRNITPTRPFFESSDPSQVVKTYLWDSPFFILIYELEYKMSRLLKI